jgi:murein DD-endopeptidase MepM/ murein hydrolase activator NlpD
MKRRPLFLLLFTAAAAALFWLRAAKQPVPEVEVATLAPSTEGARVYCCVTDRLRSGESLYDLLLRQGLAPRTALEVGAALRPMLPPSELWPKDQVALFFDPSENLASLEIARSPLERYRLDAKGDGFVARALAIPVDTVTRTVWGRLDESLWNSFVSAGAQPSIIVAFTEVFAWTVDFFREAQPGDAFGVRYAEWLVDDRLVGAGEIDAAYYVRGGDTLWAFGLREGGEQKYYDAEGRSLRKALLRAPLKYSRVSSGFSRRRLHPVSRVYRPHYGVDYAAATGTPVYAAGDGEVRFAGRKNGLGKCIEIRHPNGYRTIYGHLNRIQSGIAPGVRVKQKQRIGSVGQTGNASGPHLHYEVRLGDKPVNPRTLKLPAKGPVPDAQRPYFEARRDSLRQILHLPYGPLLAGIG